MIPSSFDYVVAKSVAEAVKLLGQHGAEAKVLAGGHSLIPLMKLRLTAPSVLVDIGRIPELRFIREEGDDIVVGGGNSASPGGSVVPVAGRNGCSNSSTSL